VEAAAVAVASETKASALAAAKSAAADRKSSKPKTSTEMERGCRSLRGKSQVDSIRYCPPRHQMLPATSSNAL
jgi:hypothetical protein